MTTEELLQAIEREMVVTTARRAARHVRTLQADVERLTAELAALRQRVPVAKHISEHCRNGLHGHCTDPECKCDCRYCVTTNAG